VRPAPPLAQTGQLLGGRIWPEFAIVLALEMDEVGHLLQARLGKRIHGSVRRQSDLALHDRHAEQLEDGALQDGGTPLNIKEDGPPANGSNGGGEVALGKRYASPDGSVEVLCIKPGALDLKYEGQPMELMQPKVLPSAD